MSIFEQNARVFVAGHRGMVGRAVVRQLRAKGSQELVLRTRNELDLRNQLEVREFFRSERPDYVILCAAKVGGIGANVEAPAEFFFDNIAMQTNVIHESHRHGVKKCLVLGTSCIYPRECPQPMKEEYLLTGKLEPTNEGYALAKIAGLRMAQYYYQQYGFKSVCPIPCNLYGTNDSFDPEKSHVLAALVRKFVDVVDSGEEKVVVWGTGTARREFMHVDDAASAILFLMERIDSPEFINVGWGHDVTILELTERIASLTGFKGKLVWDHSKPDGMPRKCLDVTKLETLGWKPQVPLDEGIARTIREYRDMKRNRHEQETGRDAG